MYHTNIQVLIPFVHWRNDLPNKYGVLGELHRQEAEERKGERGSPKQEAQSFQGRGFSHQ